MSAESTSLRAPFVGLDLCTSASIVAYAWAPHTLVTAAMVVAGVGASTLMTWLALMPSLALLVIGVRTAWQGGAAPVVPRRTASRVALSLATALLGVAV